jgi:magnesium transporter
VSEISDHLAEESSVVWLDLRDPDREDLAVLTSWAAIVAVPTFITGFYGMNVPYPGFQQHWGVLFSVAAMVVIAAVLYVVFRVKDWL